MTEAAPWLKAMENGGLGEARAKAFLMDRFWVLERSVDVEGADYLVQRRLTAQNFMDRDPPRLGVVQVKFIQDGGTGISIHKSYVCDDGGSPYKEFFLLVFTGREDGEKSYLLSSEEILSNFREVADGKRTLLRLGGAKLMATSNFEVTQKRSALDRIDHALRNADFLANRKFLGSTSYIKISPDHIDEDYLKPLDNQYGDVQREFFEGKRKLQSVLIDIEEVAGAMQRMLLCTDPIEAVEIYEDGIAQHVNGYGKLDLGSARDFGLDEDLIATAKNYKARLAKLRELGLMGNYFKLLDQYESTLVERLADPAFDAGVKTIKVTLTYDAKTLGSAHVEVSVGNTDQTTPHLETSRKGQQVAYLDLNDTLPAFAGTASTDREDRAKLIGQHLRRGRRPVHAEVDRLYLGEDLVAF